MEPVLHQQLGPRQLESPRRRVRARWMLRGGWGRAAALLATVVLVAACGSTSPASPAPTATPPPTPAPTPAPTAASAAAILADAVDATLMTGTVSLDMTMTFVGSSRIPEGTSMAGTARLSFGKPRQTAMTLDMTEIGQGVGAMIMDEPVVWVRFNGPLGIQLGADGRWIKVDAAATGRTADALRAALSGPNDSSLLLYYLLGAGADAKLVGPEAAGNVPATRIDATLDLDVALTRVPATVRDALVVNMADIRRQAIPTQLASRTWVDNAGLVRRLELDYALSSLQGGGTMRAAVTFGDFGKPLDLGIPDDKDVIPVEQITTGR